MRKKGAASWTNVVIGRGGEKQYGIMYSKRPMSGNQMPAHNDQVFIYLPESGGQNLERDRSITLLPVTTDVSAAKRSASMIMRAGQAEDLEREMFLPLAAGAAAFAWASWGTYLAAGFLPAFALATGTKPASLEASRALALKKHAGPLHMKVDGEVVSFKSASELERKMFLPLLAAPLFFFPWGFALGATFFACDASKALAPFYSPVAAWWKADHSALYKDMASTSLMWFRTWWFTYVSWAFLGFWWWWWVFYSVYWQPAIANFWFGVYKFWYDYWAKAATAGGVVPSWWSYWLSTWGKMFGGKMTAPIPTTGLPTPSTTPMPTPAAVPAVEMEKSTQVVEKSNLAAEESKPAEKAKLL